jgi:autoinducer 2-degrading protein
MYVVQVFLKVKPEHEEDFIRLSEENARNSRHEPGIVRFDLFRNKEQTGSFTLWEMYHTPGDVDAHKQTMHYRRWVQAVEDMLVEPRTRTFWTSPESEDME